MKVEQNKLDSGELEIKLTFSSYDQMCLEHDLIDIADWYSKGPASEKIHSCQKRMINENKDMLLQSDQISSMSVGQMNDLMKDPDKICEMIYKLPAYKNRKARQAK